MVPIKTIWVFLFHGNFLWITLGFDVPNLVPWNRVPLRLLVVKSTTQKSLNRRQSTKKWTIFQVYVSINNGWIIHLHPVMRFNQFLRGSQVRFVRHKFIVKNSEPKRSFFSKWAFFGLRSISNSLLSFAKMVEISPDQSAISMKIFKTKSRSRNLISRPLR